jgi:hypothetical protein
VNRRTLRTALRILTLAASLVAALPRPVSAEWQLAPFVGWTFKGSTTLPDLAGGQDQVHWTFGGAATLIADGPLGVEGLFLYTPGFFGSGLGLVNESRTLALMGNVVLATPRAWNEYGLRPFVSGGLGLLHASLEDAQDLFPVRENLLGINVGGGAVGFLTDRTGLRFDLRYFRHLKPGEEGDAFGDVRLSYWTGTIGVVFRY